MRYISEMRIRCVLKNIRRLKSKAYNSGTINSTIVSEYFGYGQGSACKFCRELGFDPDGNEFTEGMGDN